MAVPAGAKEQTNPSGESPEVIADARAHWADHCAACHANNGSGDTEIGRHLYPPAPDMREADEEALLLADIYVDTREGALRESGELTQAMASGALAPADIRGQLCDLVAGTVAGRTTPRQVTLFKSVGTAIEDLAAAELALA